MVYERTWKWRVFINIPSPGHFKVVKFSKTSSPSSYSKNSNTLDKKPISLFFLIWSFDEVSCIITSFSPKALTDETSDDFLLITFLAFCFLIWKCTWLLLAIVDEYDESFCFLSINVSISFCSSGMYFRTRETVPGILTFFCHKKELY